MKGNLRRVALLGTYVPRLCGIGTFTRDLRTALNSRFSGVDFRVLAMSDRDSGYAYPPEVRFDLSEQHVESYRRAADFLNINNFDLVSLQHEFGIFGGPAGSHILTFLKELRMPVVTTVHTVLRSPTEPYRRVFKELLDHSDHIVVMGERGKEFLKEIYRLPESKISLIPHGIPDVPFYDPNYYKGQFGVSGKTVVLTFGLLGPGKGIEYAIEALPQVLQRFPNLVYIVLGATHPYWMKQEGEAYRLHLQRLAERHRVEKHVIFYNRFVSQEDLMEFIGASDLYITPYLQKEQITSGTLTLAVGTGKAVISTPYYYAEELLADERGILVPFKDPGKIAEALSEVIGNEAKRHAMRKRAYDWSRNMTWSCVAERYYETFSKTKASARLAAPPKTFALKTLEERPYPLPSLRLQHLDTLTDSTGILHSAIHNIPNFADGYRTDDNARAFVLANLLEELGEATRLPTNKHAVSTYLSFIHYAFEPATGRFRNRLNFHRLWEEEEGSDDTHGRALWTLGTAIGRTQSSAYRSVAGQLFSWALPAVYRLISLRGWAHALVGIHEYLRHFGGDRAAMAAGDALTRQLEQSYEANASSDWPWFESSLSYENARLPHALIVSGRRTGNDSILEIGLKSLQWLTTQETSQDGSFSPVGDEGEYHRGGNKSRFGQRPNDVYVMISACLEAYRVTQKSDWLQFARRAFEWFLGRNDLGQPLYDPRTGGCRDALRADRVSENLGAEASLAFYLSLVELRLAEDNLRLPSTADAGASL